MANKETVARLQFATWLKKSNPALFQRAYEQALNGYEDEQDDDNFGAVKKPGTVAPAASGGSFWERFTTGLTSLVTTATALRAQRAVLSTNIQRAQQGLPPISMDYGAPVIRTQIDLTPEVANRLQVTAAEGTKKLLLYGGIAAVAFFLLRGGKR